MLPFSYPAGAFEDFGAFKEWQAREEKKKKKDRHVQGDGFEAADGLPNHCRGAVRPGYLFPCFRSLFQGDHLGV